MTGRQTPALSAAAGEALEPADHASLTMAAEWFATLRAEDAGERERCEWRAWLAASPRHRAAWQRIEAVGERFGRLNVAAAPAAREVLANGKWQRRRAIRALGWLGLGAATGAGLLDSDEARAYLAAQGADYRTDVGETRRLVLADGTQLWLDTASAVDVDYSATLRRIRLHRGEILVQSARDPALPARPLVVDVAQGRLRALGTRFTVDVTGPATRLAVFDGAVRIEAARAAPVVVAAGFERRFDGDGAGPAERTAESSAAWSENRLVADNTRLDVFLAQLNRYRHGHLACAPGIGNFRLTGSYPLADTDRVLAALEATLPVTVTRILPWWTTVEARRG